MPVTLLLASGLKNPASSFYRQLSLLGTALDELGARVEVTGPDLAPRRADGVILLGYPDQFAAGRWKTRVFLWAQFSRPPRPGSLEGLLPVPLTPATARHLEDAGCDPAGPVIPHGVDEERFTPRPGGSRGGRRRPDGSCPGRLRSRRTGGFTVGTVAANNPRKKLDRIVDAFALFLRGCPGSSLVVKTDRAVSTAGFDLREHVRRAGVSGCTRIVTGDLDAAGMRDLYRDMDLYLNLSEWEGFCIPVIEAMACGVPVACQPIQGPGELVPYRDLLVHGGRRIDDAGTLLVEPDPRRAADVLERARRNPGLLERLAAAGREEVLRRYRIRPVAERWLELARENPVHRGKA
jgi:glycosyltransferase involved in cell wall biosynthesis